MAMALLRSMGEHIGAVTAETIESCIEGFFPIFDQDALVVMGSGVRPIYISSKPGRLERVEVLKRQVKSIMLREMQNIIERDERTIGS